MVDGMERVREVMDMAGRVQRVGVSEAQWAGGGEEENGKREGSQQANKYAGEKRKKKGISPATSLHIHTTKLHHYMITSLQVQSNEDNN